jgi:preprotein translocase subunit SecD
MKIRQKIRLQFGLVVLLAVFAGFFAYPQAMRFLPQKVQNVLTIPKINLGLDLQGGVRLKYALDLSAIDSTKRSDALDASLAVIERRVNAFGVGESLVQLAKSGNEDQIIVELPGVKDIEQAKKMLKDTPILEFKEEAGPDVLKMFDDANTKAKSDAETMLARTKNNENFEDLAKQFSEDPGSKDTGGDLGFAKKGQFVPEFDDVIFNPDFKLGEVWTDLVESQFGWHIIKKVEERGDGDTKEVRAEHILFRKQTLDMYPELAWTSTGLTGKNLTNAQIDRQSQGLSKPQVAIEFDDEGAKLFANLTKKNLGKRMAILIDGQIVSAPTVQSEITNGKAVITGNFTEKEAKDLVVRLNEGALPVPITPIEQESISASLGDESLHKSLFAGMIGVAAVIVFMILYYRLLGLIAAFALLLYTALLMTVFKFSSLTPFAITLTLSGIAGFILSIGMAVDANILIFERTWEELKNGKSLPKAIEEGFRRAWPSIRDGNSSTMLTCLILIWMGTGFVKGFAIILMIGVLFSMFTAIVLVKTLIRFSLGEWVQKRMWLIAPKRKLPKEKLM